MQQKGDLNKSRRRFLVGATTAVGAAGTVGVAVPFIKSWSPSAKAQAAGAPVKADISKLEPGQYMIVEWRGKPVFIVNRTKESLEQMTTIMGSLLDPVSEDSDQPGYAQNDNRSIKPEILVMVGLCTHLGCSPKYRPEVAPELGEDWVGGFFCPCHGSTFDMAGRVYKGVPAPKNLPVPPHSYEGDNIIIIGVDQEVG